MSTWLKNNLIKSWFLRRVGHWFMAWKVKWRAPGLRRKFGHKFTHIFYFHRGEVAKFLKVELFLLCPENHVFSLSPRYICRSYPRKHFVCVSSVSSCDRGALDRCPDFSYSIKWTSPFSKPDILPFWHIVAEEEWPCMKKNKKYVCFRETQRSKKSTLAYC